MSTLYIDRQGSQLTVQTGVLHIATPNGEADRRLPLHFLRIRQHGIDRYAGTPGYAQRFGVGVRIGVGSDRKAHARGLGWAGLQGGCYGGVEIVTHLRAYFMLQ